MNPKNKFSHFVKLMFRIYIFLFLAVPSKVVAMNVPVTNKNCMTMTQKMLIGGAIGAGGVAVVIAAPMILPASTVIAMKATAGIVAAKATAVSISIKGATVTIAPVIKVIAPVVSCSKIGINVSIATKEYFYPNTEQKVQRLLKERTLEKPFAQQLKEISIQK